MTLQVVADVELGYELAPEGLELASDPISDKQLCLAELETLHRMELNPYARRLNELERRTRSLMA